MGYTTYFHGEFNLDKLLKPEHVSWQGEDSDDRGIIYAVNNYIEAVRDEIINRGPKTALQRMAEEG